MSAEADGPLDMLAVVLNFRNSNLLGSRLVWAGWSGAGPCSSNSIDDGKLSQKVFQASGDAGGSDMNSRHIHYHRVDLSLHRFNGRNS